MSTLIRIPAWHMRFVPAHKQSDEVTPVLSPAEWPVEYVLIANDKGWETFVSLYRIHQILSSSIQATCLLMPAQTLFFPTQSSRGRFGGSLTPPPRKPLPTRPATPTHTSPRGPATPPNRTPPGNINVEDPTPRLDTHPNASYPQFPADPVGIGTPHEKVQDDIAAGSPAALGPLHPGRGYNSSQPLPDLEDIPVFSIQHDKDSRLRHYIHGSRNSSRNIWSTPMPSTLLPVTPASGRLWCTFPPPLSSTYMPRGQKRPAQSCGRK